MDTKGYIALIKEFINKNISVDDFSKQYEENFLAEKAGMDPELFIILEDLFEAILVYDPDVAKENENLYKISEITFVNEVSEIYEKLLKYSAY